jgi:hypothetical protein
MRTADIIFLYIILITYFRSLDFKYSLRHQDTNLHDDDLLPGFHDVRLQDAMRTQSIEDIELKPLAWGAVAIKAAIVLLPAFALWLTPLHSKLIEILGFVGLTVLLGPATFRGSSSLEKSPQRQSRFQKSVVRRLVDKLSYDVADKLQTIFLGLVLYSIIFFVRLTTGFTVSVSGVIPRAPYFPAVYGLQSGNIISESTWLLIIMCLFLKVMMSATNLLYFIIRGFISTIILSVILEYTGFIGVSSYQFFMSMLLAIIIRRP